MQFKIKAFGKMLSPTPKVITFRKKQKRRNNMKNELTYVKAEIEIIEAGEDIIRTSSIDLPDIDLTEI